MYIENDANILLLNGLAKVKSKNQEQVQIKKSIFSNFISQNLDSKFYSLYSF